MGSPMKRSETSKVGFLKKSKFGFSRNLNFRIMNIYFDNFCRHKFKARFSKRFCFAIEDRYFEKDLSN